MPQIIGAADTRRKGFRKRCHSGHPGLQRGNVLRGEAPRYDRGTPAASDTSGGRLRQNGTQCHCGLTPTRWAENRSVSLDRKCKRCISGQIVQSSNNDSTADYDRV
jgi:hypothetical protein